MPKLKIFLTGGSGMVGRNLLLHSKAKYFSIDAPSRQQLDLTSKSEVLVYLNKTKPDLIIHAAGKVGGIEANMADPFGFLVENLSIGLNVVSAAFQAGIPRLINLGSSCIYPKDINGSLTEDLLLSSPLEPTNEGYALAKIAVIRMCEYASEKSPDLCYKTLVPCNLYGPFDKFDCQQAHLIPAIIRKIYQAVANDEKTVEIWGDGTARREFMYVGDLSDLIFRAIDEFESLPKMMNVGMGLDYSILDYYTATARIMDWSGSFSFNMNKPVGMKRKLLNVDQQINWGWKSKTSLEDGIDLTAKYYKEFSNVF
jgi:GDP-L-fucose synthase